MKSLKPKPATPAQQIKKLTSELDVQRKWNEALRDEAAELRKQVGEWKALARAAGRYIADTTPANELDIPF